nr:MAG TPA: hypothetical protein [Caudoviricetes sp.]
MLVNRWGNPQLLPLLHPSHLHRLINIVIPYKGSRSSFIFLFIYYMSREERERYRDV